MGKQVWACGQLLPTLIRRHLHSLTICYIIATSSRDREGQENENGFSEMRSQTQADRQREHDKRCRNLVSYEWKRETIDQRDPVESMESDIIDADYAAPGELRLLFPLENNQRVCLVRNYGSDANGLQERDHAYMSCGVLATETSDDGHSVPQRFQQEVASL